MGKRIIVQALDAASKMAVDGGVPERTYVELARESYRRFGGAPREGRPPLQDSWSPLVDAVGGVGALADELATDRRNLTRWRSGDASPDAALWKSVRALARRKKVEPPMTEEAKAVLKKLNVTDANALFVWKGHGGSSPTIAGAQAASHAARDLFVASNGPQEIRISRGIYNELVGAGAKDETVRERTDRRGY